MNFKSMMKRFAATAIFLCICLCAYSQANGVSGVVFLDRNGNGLQDAGERGLKNIPVSNGDTIILTTRGGHFSLPDSGEAFPIVPSGYVATGGKIGNVSLKGAMTDGTLYFSLEKQNQKGDFRVAAVGDVQVNDPMELAYATRTIFSELSDRRDIDLAVYLGDLVNDNMTLLPAIERQLELMPHTSWTLPGNHDLDFTKGIPRTPDSYSQVFGPTDYAFNYGKTIFIVLDDATDERNREIEGRLSERQRRFVANCLAITPDDYTVVMCVHIPVDGKYRDETVTLFTGRERVLILAGHTHTTYRHLLAPNVCELVAGAAGGSWWTGERGPDAVPLAIQPCGTPRNYFIVDFSDEGYSLTFKGVGLDPSIGMDVWVKGEEVIDNDVDVLAELPDGTIVANIYGGSGDVTKVEMRVDGGEWQPMEHMRIQAPVVSRIRHWNSTAGFPTAYSRRTPIRRTASPHVWSAILPEGLSGIHSVEIHASDEYGFETSYTREFIK
jgi:3',5'-cyclic AMP phosphodiesterase CpdA